MKKNRVICLFLAWLLIFCCLIPEVFAVETDQSVTNGCHSPNAVIPLSDEGKLVETSKAVIVYELSSDTLLYTWNPDQKIYPSSMVKLMTVLLALENGELTDKVLVTKRALSYVAVGSVSAGLVSGEELSLQDLLYCAMVASANDATTVIAEYIGGTQDAFVEMMNQRARELGCTGTHYSNVHGLHDAETYTTVRDICRILDYALDIPEFKQMFCTESYTVPATNKNDERNIETTNYMLSKLSVKKYYDARVTGGKTGATDEAGRCFAATAEGNGMELLTIVMGAEPTYEKDGISLERFGSFEETRELLDYAFANFEYRQIFYAGQAIAQYPVEGGANSVVGQPEKTASTVLPVNLDSSRLTWIYGESAGTLVAPIEKGLPISVVQVWYGAKCLAQAELVAATSVTVRQDLSAFDNPMDGVEDETGKIIGLICGGLLGVGAVVTLSIFAVKFVRKMVRQARLRRRRQQRRRSR